jgi:hypothetical protein
MNISGTVGWFVNSRLLHRRTVPRFQGRLFDVLVPLQAMAERRLQPSFGLSLVAVGLKPEIGIGVAPRAAAVAA